MAQAIGTIGWIDLTIPDAETNKSFYGDVIGCEMAPTDMEGYNDYTIIAGDGKGVAGVCHARGSNKGLPPMWLPYFIVASVGKSIERAKAGGGEVVHGPKGLAGGQFAAIKDPTGAFFAVWEEGTS